MKNLRILILAMMLVGARESIFAGEGDLSENPSIVEVKAKKGILDKFSPTLYEKGMKSIEKICPKKSHAEKERLYFIVLANKGAGGRYAISISKMLDEQLGWEEGKHRVRLELVNYAYKTRHALSEISGAQVLVDSIHGMADDIHQSKLSELIEFADYLLKSHENGEVVDWKLEAKRAQFHINPPTDKDDLEDVFLYQRDQKVRKMRGALRKFIGAISYSSDLSHEDLSKMFSEDKEQCKKAIIDAFEANDNVFRKRLFPSNPSSIEEERVIRWLFESLELDINPIFAKYKDEFKKMRQEETDAMWSDKSKAPKVSPDLDESDINAMICLYGIGELHEFIFNNYLKDALVVEFNKITEENKSYKDCSLSAETLSLGGIAFETCNGNQKIAIHHIKYGAYEAAKEHIDAFVKSYVMPRAEVFAKNYVENLKKS
ncbi:hypothetical protein FZC35_02605 [Candidatus Cytomitobacter indipagum]|uniref:Uncharacterized protein n=1 Tax=Candidatus Cytomitobacter indipagum TaxID=2601575 RepID=A0A5C0UG50_9PROT|nr:hypothetical protein [Candidatus Cytomitobacter indipagum]QEK38242.1 hypothetical protein FZC35_02605 [Candidatus Cytomitobacter indipagum]